MTAITTLLLPSFASSSADLGGADSEDFGRSESGQYDLAVVIDVLRATTVMVTALNSGAAGVITCRSIDEARGLADKLQDQAVLCGERHCQKIDGFHLGNSPTEYAREVIGGKQVILTTTNGTRAIEAMHHVPELVIASFLNLSTIVKKIASVQTACIVCAGTNGEVTSEDVLLAGALISQLNANGYSLTLDDASKISALVWESFQGANVASLPSPQLLAIRLRETQGGKTLVNLGYERDLLYCGQINSCSVLPRRVGKSPTRFS